MADYYRVMLGRKSAYAETCFAEVLVRPAALRGSSPQSGPIPPA
jgi:hypothetical protein